jgi:hypothetical protein
MTETPYVFEGTNQDAELERRRKLEAVFEPGTRACLLATYHATVRASGRKPGAGGAA